MATNDETTTRTANIVVGYADATARTYNFKGVSAEDYTQVGTRVRALNSNMPDSFKQTFLSNAGAQATQISKVTLVEQTEEVIYSAN